MCFDQELSTKEMLEGAKVLVEDKEEYARGITEALEVARTYKTEGGHMSESDEEKYPLVTFLGTGSSVPSKYRNVTGIMVETQPGSFIINGAVLITGCKGSWTSSVQGSIGRAHIF